jgi:hypothetical protein
MAEAQIPTLDPLRKGLHPHGYGILSNDSFLDLKRTTRVSTQREDRFRRIFGMSSRVVSPMLSMVKRFYSVLGEKGGKHVARTAVNRSY